MCGELCCCWVCRIYLCACLIRVFFRRRLSALLECAGELLTCHVRYFVACSRVVTAWQKRCELRLRNACVWCSVIMFRSCLHLSQHQHQTARLTKTQKIYTRKEIICLCLLKYTSHFPPLFLKHRKIQNSLRASVW